MNECPHCPHPASEHEPWGWCWECPCEGLDRGMHPDDQPEVNDGGLKHNEFVIFAETFPDLAAAVREFERRFATKIIEIVRGTSGGGVR